MFAGTQLSTRLLTTETYITNGGEANTSLTLGVSDRSHLFMIRPDGLHLIGSGHVRCKLLTCEIGSCKPPLHKFHGGVVQLARIAPS